MSNSIRIRVSGQSGRHAGMLEPKVGMILPQGEVVKVNKKSVLLSRPDRDNTWNETELSARIWELPVTFTDRIEKFDGSIYQPNDYEKAMITLANTDVDTQSEAIGDIAQVALSKMKMEEEVVKNAVGSMSGAAILMVIGRLYHIVN